MNSKELQLQKWALDGILITRVTQDEADAAPWTRFVNRGTVKPCPVPWVYVMIQSTKIVAVNLFTTLFGFNPSEIHCKMCGPHFSIDVFCECLVYPGSQLGQDDMVLCIKDADIQGIIDSRYELLPGEDPDKGFEISDVKMTHDALECTVTINPPAPNIKMEDLMSLVNTLYPTGLKPSLPDLYTKLNKLSPMYEMNPKSSYYGGLPWNYVHNFKGVGGIASWESWDTDTWTSKPRKK